jgi:hypothetical protein
VVEQWLSLIMIFFLDEALQRRNPWSWCHGE